MRKTLLFNGCSFVAGDAVTWDLFTNEFSWHDLTGKSGKTFDNASMKRMADLHHEYCTNFRDKTNLPAQCAYILGSDKIDLSQDGNSNDNIALSTISYLMGILPTARKQYHVCIGWTCTDRRILWKKNKFKNLTFEMTQPGPYADDYAQQVLSKNRSVDNNLNLIMNIIMLEKYLQNNEITYTFWLSINRDHVEMNKISYDYLNNLLPHAYYPPTKTLQMSSISNVDKWITFNDKYVPWFSESWHTTMTVDDRIDNINGHPNLKTVKKFAQTLTNHIKNYG